MLKHKLYVWGSVALIVLLSLFFIVSASASVSSPSGNYDVYDNINFTEASQYNEAFYGENSKGKYISVYSSSALKGYADYYIYGKDFELMPPNYSYTSVTIILGGFCNWTQAPTEISQDNTFTVTFSIVGNNNSSIYRSSSVTLAQGESLFNIGVQLTLEEFQQIGFGINGFVITLKQPIYSTQAIIYNPTIIYRYSAVIVAPTTPPPTPTPIPLITPDIPLITLPPGNPADEWHNLLPLNDGALYVMSDFFSMFYDMPYLGGFIRLVIMLGAVVSITGIVITCYKRRK